VKRGDFQRLCLFTPSRGQIERLLEINEVLWKDLAITEQAIHELGDPPRCPSSDEEGLYCLNLLYETGNALVTFQRNWLACRLVLSLPRTWKWDGLLFTPQGVRLRDNAMFRRPGLRWQIAELGRQFKCQCVRDVRPKLHVMGMGQELPLIAVLHPKWAVSMNADDIPYVDAPDLEVASYGLEDSDFSFAPRLCFSHASKRQVGLVTSHMDDPHSQRGSGSLL